MYDTLFSKILLEQETYSFKKACIYSFSLILFPYFQFNLFFILSKMIQFNPFYYIDVNVIFVHVMC